MIENEKQLKEVLDVLNKEGILTKSIIIGSWCLLFYKYIFENFEPTLRTTDIDFYVPNPKSIKANDSVISSLKDINYDMVHDSCTNRTSFISPEGFEIEFLTKLNRNQLPTIQLGNTGIHAESIPYVEIFAGSYIEVNYEGIIVKVASPASYVIQKLLINDDRKEKKEKDIESIKHVLFYVNVSRKYLDELVELYNSLPPKWKKKIDLVAKNNDINLFQYVYKIPK